MARPRTVSDAQILDAARESVLEHGPRVSLNEVAQRVGVSQPALLKRFGSRRQLMLKALVPTSPPPWIEGLSHGPDARPFAAQLRSLIAAIGEDVEKKVPCLSALRESGIPREEVLACLDPSLPRANLKAVTAWLERAVAMGLLAPRAFRLESAAAILIGAVSARYHVQHVFNRPWTKASDEEFAEDLIALFLRALGPESPTSSPEPA